jgi:hypothetical protein
MLGLDGQGYRQVGVANTGRPEEDHILVLANKGEIKEFQGRLLIQMWMEREILLLNGLGAR